MVVKVALNARTGYFGRGVARGLGGVQKGALQRRGCRRQTEKAQKPLLIVVFKGKGTAFFGKRGDVCGSGNYLCIFEYHLVLAGGYGVRGSCFREYLLTSDHEQSSRNWESNAGVAGCLKGFV